MNYLSTAGTALKRWFIAQCYDALAVAALWEIGLLIIGVPWAPLWAVLGGALQFVPSIGPIIAVIGPCFAALLSQHPDRFFWVLTLYAIIVVIDGLVLQPYLMKRSNRVPIWASIITPLLLGFFFNVWGVLASGPLLAIIYAFRSKGSPPLLPREPAPPNGYKVRLPARPQAPAGPQVTPDDPSRRPESGL